VNATTATSPLLFSWAPPHGQRRALTIFLLASVILHALCFYIFQIVYPPAVALPPVPARLSVISPDDPESVALLRWVEAEDPALASTTQRPAGYKAFPMPKLEHIPSYAQHEPALRTMPAIQPDLRIPSSAAIGQKPHQHTAAAAPPLGRKTAILFSDGGPPLGQPVLPAFAFHISRPDAPANARFRILVDDQGTIRYCFRIDSSGDPALDEQAREYLLLCRFPASPQTSGALRWSVATILWGNDLAPLNSTPPAP
jgi:hypothetical protein